jgi:predicted Zn-dependent protease
VKDVLGKIVNVAASAWKIENGEVTDAVKGGDVVWQRFSIVEECFGVG